MSDQPAGAGRLIQHLLEDEAATVAAGNKLAKAVETVGLAQGLSIYLLGDLGAGKTTFSRGVIQAFGHSGAVKSPTYTLVEPYDIVSGAGRSQSIYHFDLYRLADPAELEFLGLDDYFCSSSLCLVEWPARGAGFIPAADIEVSIIEHMLDTSDGQRNARQIQLQAKSPAGDKVLAHMA